MCATSYTSWAFRRSVTSHHHAFILCSCSQYVTGEDTGGARVGVASYRVNLQLLQEVHALHAV